jgi:predicted amino acid racemase
MALVGLCKGMSVVGVTKATCGDPAVGRAMLAGGVAMLGDSRVGNLRRLRRSGIEGPLLLLRSPRPSAVDDVVRWADISLNSEPGTVRALGTAALEAGVEHGVVLMVDLGDRREGVLPSEVVDIAREVHATEGVRLEGVGTNLACFAGVVPTSDKMERLVGLAREVEGDLGVKLSIVSGGNSANVPLQMTEGHPEGVNNLRIGEAILLGLETVTRTPIPGTHQDAFVIEGELVEARPKPSAPDGVVGQDAFGHVREVEDRGIIRAGLVALGRQDVDPDSLAPLDAGVRVLGASSDHLVVDLGGIEAGVGDLVRFLPGYGSLLRAMTSPYVEKVHIRSGAA